MKNTAALKDKLLRILGPFPEKVSLESRIIAQEDCGLYIREKVDYMVEEGERITAFVLRPKLINGKTPAIFCHHQHAGNFKLGKSEVVGLGGNPDQAFAAELAERGFITFAPDAIAFEERNWADGDGWVEYHELATRLVQGKTLLAKVLHDIFVGIDYLQSLPDVDSRRIGFLGHSYGGRMAIWAPAFDGRIKVSVSNCGCVNFRNSLGREAGIQMEFCVPGITKVAEIEDILTMIEPRSVMILAADQDKWSKGAEELCEYARPGFSQGRLELRTYAGIHEFNSEMRRDAYRFLAENL